MLFVGGSSIVANPVHLNKGHGYRDWQSDDHIHDGSIFTGATMHYLYGWQAMIMLSIALVMMISISILVAMMRPAPAYPES